MILCFLYWCSNRLDASDVFEKGFIRTGAIWTFISCPVLLFLLYYVEICDFFWLFSFGHIFSFWRFLHLITFPTLLFSHAGFLFLFLKWVAVGLNSRMVSLKSLCCLPELYPLTLLLSELPPLYVILVFENNRCGILAYASSTTFESYTII